MRSADHSRLPALALCAALVAGLAGCASAPEPVPAAPSAKESAAAAAAVAQAQAAAKAQERERAMASVPPAARTAFEESLRAMRAGRTAEAERGLRALTQAHPDLGGPHANLGLLLRQAGKFDEAVAQLQLAVRANPEQPVYFNQLGIAYRHQGQFAKAREAYERAIDLDPAYATATLNLGVLHDLYLGDSARALTLYGRYLALVPGGDPVVGKWVADLKNRKPVAADAARKEKE